MRWFLASSSSRRRRAVRARRGDLRPFRPWGWLLVLALIGSSLGCAKKRRTPLAWGIGVHKFDARRFGLTQGSASDPFADGITDQPQLAIPTYDGSGQATHPDVLLERGPQGVRAVMAMTPYRFSDKRLENPSVLVSSDGMAFHDIPGRPNPLVPPPPTDHNDDPDLRWDAAAHEYEILYLETESPVKQSLVSLRSPDLITWKRSDAIVYDFTKSEDFIVSPAVVYDGNLTHLFYVNLSTKQFSDRLEVMSSADGRSWDRTKAESVAIDLHGVTPWHIDVVAGDTGYAMLIAGYVTDFNHQNLYIATSKDLKAWTLETEPLLAYTDPTLRVDSLYRSTGVVAGTSLIVWYSMKYRP